MCSPIYNLTLRVLRGDRLGVVGANGAGKTTLLRLLTGGDQPDSGTIALGPSLSMVTLDQQRRTLNPERTLAETLTDGGGDMVQIGDEKRHVIGYMKDFLFRPEQARTPVSALSGGERGRLMLACALAKPSNLLILDEPTNDLDLETLDILQDMLCTYSGTVLLVSHDRDFLDRIATSVLAADGTGTWVEYAGGYSDMLVQRNLQPLENTPTIPNAEPTKPREQPTRQATRKLSYKDQYALDNLPLEMEKLEAQAHIHRTGMADPDLYAKNPNAFDRHMVELGKIETRLAECEEQWLELEMKREALLAE